MYAEATQRGLLSVVSVLASLATVVTVTLSDFILGERLSVLQRAGRVRRARPRASATKLRRPRSARVLRSTAGSPSPATPPAPPKMHVHDARRSTHLRPEVLALHADEQVGRRRTSPTSPIASADPNASRPTSAAVPDPRGVLVEDLGSPRRSDPSALPYSTWTAPESPARPSTARPPSGTPIARSANAVDVQVADGEGGAEVIAVLGRCRRSRRSPAPDARRRCPARAACGPVEDLHGPGVVSGDPRCPHPARPPRDPRRRRRRSRPSPRCRPPTSRFPAPSGPSAPSGVAPQHLRAPVGRDRARVARSRRRSRWPVPVARRDRRLACRRRAPQHDRDPRPILDRARYAPPPAGDRDHGAQSRAAPWRPPLVVAAPARRARPRS